MIVLIILRPQAFNYHNYVCNVRKKKKIYEEQNIDKKSQA